MEQRTLQVILSNDAEDFIKLQPLKAQQKITYNIRKIQSGIRDKELFKKLDNTEIWELRTLYNGICYRLFTFWDTEEQSLIIATHGIIKKSQKTPKKEITKAEQIREAYFKDKHN